MQADMRVAHFSFELSTWNKRCNTIHDDYIDRARTDQSITNFKRLLASVGLAEEEIIYIHP